MITLTAKLKAKPGMEKEVEEIARSMFPSVNSEKGIIAYTLHCDVKDAGSFMFYEQYADDDALKTHQDTPHFKQLVARLEGKLAGATEETFYTVIDKLNKQAS
jgi:quinol monooxygenase YgiN